MNKSDRAASRRVNSWVDPSFSDLSEKSFFTSGRRKANPSFSKPEQKKIRRRKGEGSSPLLSGSTRGDGDEPWVDRYSPCSQTELAVHKKKVEEVETWIRAHTDASKAGLLILTGPSGCGKTATVQVLCQEMGIRVQEWTNTSNLVPYSSSQHDWKMNGSPYSSQVAQFQEFLLRANKYNCLKMVGDEETTHRKLILVEDFPNQFYRQPFSLHDILRCFVKSSQCSLVFIVSDSPSGGSRLPPLFPREIQEELGISCIRFTLWKLLFGTEI